MNTKLILLYRALDVMVSKMSLKAQWSVTERVLVDSPVAAYHNMKVRAKVAASDIMKVMVILVNKVLEPRAGSHYRRITE